MSLSSVHMLPNQPSRVNLLLLLLLLPVSGTEAASFPFLRLLVFGILVLRTDTMPEGHGLSPFSSICANMPLLTG